ncbi:Inner membrane protein YcfT [Nocardioides dokdonensis FR1436]|uniref:Inner membrane protein YcfT n=1 Tax=Nocardioides dokdonensis FR1436 TaxID=1300347 RepID=A0A1A9GIE0_9ACTN|nr:Inner membrane protein YcfT [Nocardioides dokdonensis FR1436]
MAGAAASRERWIDVAKGVSILLVVLHHAVVKNLPMEAPEALAGVVGGWDVVTTALKPVRMPLFFVLSGFVASRAVHRPWVQVRRRALTPYYTYVVWLLLLGAFFSVERLLPMNRTQDLGELGTDLVWASTGTWFLYALAVYFLLARLLSALPATWVLSGAVTLSVVSSELGIQEWNRFSVLFHFTYFALGALAPQVVRRVAERAPVPLPVLAAAYVGFTVLLWQLDLPTGVYLLLASGLGVPLGVRSAVVLARTTRPAQVLAWIGRRTLPVYVMHTAVLATLLHLPPVLDLESGSVLRGVLHPVVVTAIAVLVPLGAHAVLLRLGATWLFALPQRRPHPRPAPATRSGQASRRSTEACASTSEGPYQVSIRPSTSSLGERSASGPSSAVNS